MKRSILISFVFSVVLTSAEAQFALGELTLEGDVAHWYDETIGSARKGLFEGIYYESDVATRTLNTHLFYKERFWSKGELVFRGIRYSNVELAFDALHDVLMINNTSFFPPQPMLLNQSQVSEFNLTGSHFEYFSDANITPFHEGFYEVLHRGEKTTVLVRRRKMSVVENEAVEYVEDDRYFVKMDTTYLPLKSLRSILKVFDESKPEIREFVRANRLKVKPGNDEAIRNVLKFCEEVED